MTAPVRTPAQAGNTSSPADLPAGTRVVLVGLGPHARRIYVPFLREMGARVDALVELQSAAEAAARAFPAADLVVVSDAERDAPALDEETVRQLDAILARAPAPAWRVIIASEPKSHLAYLRYFTSRRVASLVDKPITCPTDVVNDRAQAHRVDAEYRELVQATMGAPHLITVQCQRRYHAGYRLIKSLLADTVAQHGVPVTSLDVYHCDGMWNMPHEFLTRENHPYKYGYGKLFHSGYHFVDLAAWLLTVNVASQPAHRADCCDLYAVSTGPFDAAATLPDSVLARFFGDAAPSWAPPDALRPLGELDVYALAQFYRDDRVLTTLTLSLLQTGFSRRAWPELPPDTYKGNGRVRHERLNIQIGPLLNVQVHSYQSRQIADRLPGTDADVGGVEHFDIDVYRNCALIGGVPHERWRMPDLAPQVSDNLFMGYNEAARQECLRDFLLGSGDGWSRIDTHGDSVALTAKLYECLGRQRAGERTALRFPWGQGPEYGDPACPGGEALDEPDATSSAPVALLS